jgi:hypothetical protein
MKKAFDQNVSRAKPKLKLGAPEGGAPDARDDEGWVYEVAARVAGQHAAAVSEVDRSALADAPTVRRVLDAAAHPGGEPTPEAPSARRRVEATLRGAAGGERDASPVGSPATGRSRSSESTRATAGPAAQGSGRATSLTPPDGGRSSAAVRSESRPAARAASVSAPSGTVSVRSTGPTPSSEGDSAARRERLRERLRTVRENPRPEPLPTSVAAAGVLAVERIAQLQAELTQVKQHNAALQHDLDVARRVAERATEEARGRVEEARRLSAQMEERAGLLSELERELQSVEGERDEALLAVQDARTQAAAEHEERERLTVLLGTKDAELADSLSEEERLAGELERFRDQSVQLHRSVEVLSAERDTLARQVADLTAERAELLEARKALESVHRALTAAARR